MGILNTPSPSPSAAGERPADRQHTIEAKLRCLESYLAANDAGAQAQRIETHMSWVLVGNAQVLKLKKPVVCPPVDYSSVEARECNARRELRLNRRLAPDIYLGLLGLQSHGGGLSAVAEAYLDPGSQTVDWAVVMRRLPQARMLDELIRRRELSAGDLGALSTTLAAFYRSAVHAAVDEGEYVARLRHSIALSARMLDHAAFALPRVREACQAADEALTRHEGLLRASVAEGRIVEGHGDLRAEHVCLVEPPAVFDALEFDVRLAEVDPFDELCFLGLECDISGDASLGPLLCMRIAAALDDTPAPALLRLYIAKNALMRARLSVAHLMEPDPRHPEKWLPQASRYLKRAFMALSGP